MRVRASFNNGFAWKNTVSGDAIIRLAVGLQAPVNVQTSVTFVGMA